MANAESNGSSDPGDVATAVDRPSDDLTPQHLRSKRCASCIQSLSSLSGKFRPLVASTLQNARCPFAAHNEEDGAIFDVKPIGIPSTTQIESTWRSTACWVYEMTPLVDRPA